MEYPADALDPVDTCHYVPMVLGCIVMTSGRDRDVDIELRLRTSLLHVAQILRAAVAACGATGVGAARGAATKAVKSAPYSMCLWTRCSSQATLNHLTPG